MKLISGPARLVSSRIVVTIFLIWLTVCSQSAASEQPEELLFGIEPEHNIFDQMERYRVLAGYLSEHLGIQVNLTIMSRYGEVVNRFRDRRLDGAFLSSYTAALGVTKLGLVPVVSPVHLGGESHSRGYIFARRDSGIRTPADMQGKSMVFVDPATTEGYLFPLAFLKRQGRDDVKTFFRQQYFSGSHASAIFAVLDGRADIGAAKNTVYDKQVESDPSIGDELEVIAESRNVPEETLCLRQNLPGDIKEKIERVLLSMETTSRGRKVLRQFRALRFVKATRTDLDPVMKIAEDAGISFAGPGTR
jgi:phosphonate transport system substrate-binding protein